MKGNFVAVAFGFEIGTDFKQVVYTFTGELVSPIMGLIFGSDFRLLRHSLK